MGQRIRGLGGFAARIAEARMAGTHRLHATSALDWPLPIRFYRATPL
jgi:hypothetical protein